jgi:hypothetical protein
MYDCSSVPVGAITDQKSEITNPKSLDVGRAIHPHDVLARNEWFIVIES